MFKILVLVYKAENGFHSFILFLSGETVLKFPNRTDGFHLQKYFLKTLGKHLSLILTITREHFFFGLMVPKRMNKTPVGWGKSKFFFQPSFMWMIFFPVSVLFYIKSIFHAKQSIHGTSGAGLVWFWLHRQFPKFSPFVTSFLPVRFSPLRFYSPLPIYTLNWFKFHVPSTLKVVR